MGNFANRLPPDVNCSHSALNPVGIKLAKQNKNIAPVGAYTRYIPVPSI